MRLKQHKELETDSDGDEHAAPSVDRLLDVDVAETKGWQPAVFPHCDRDVVTGTL